jgi:hypothetical protein
MESDGDENRQEDGWRTKEPNSVTITQNGLEEPKILPKYSLFHGEIDPDSPEVHQKDLMDLEGAKKRTEALKVRPGSLLGVRARGS